MKKSFLPFVSVLLSCFSAFTAFATEFPATLYCDQTNLTQLIVKVEDQKRQSHYYLLNRSELGFEERGTYDNAINRLNLNSINLQDLWIEPSMLPTFNHQASSEEISDLLQTGKTRVKNFFKQNEVISNVTPECQKALTALPDQEVLQRLNHFPELEEIAPFRYSFTEESTLIEESTTSKKPHLDSPYSLDLTLFSQIQPIPAMNPLNPSADDTIQIKLPQKPTTCTRPEARTLKDLIDFYKKENKNYKIDYEGLRIITRDPSIKACGKFGKQNLYDAAAQEKIEAVLKKKQALLNAALSENSYTRNEVVKMIVEKCKLQTTTVLDALSANKKINLQGRFHSKDFTSYYLPDAINEIGISFGITELEQLLKEARLAAKAATEQPDKDAPLPKNK